MSDDDLVIRHVCECGKPADHDGVCSPGRLAIATRIDRDWEKENAERRSARHAKRQPDYRADRIQARAALTVAELYALAAVRAAKLSPVGAGNIAPSHGAQHPSVNLALQARSVDMRSDPRWKAADERERLALLRKHELLDEYEGLGVAQAEREVGAEEKDASIVDAGNAHLSAAEFARQFPGYGSPVTVARKRRWFAAGLCTFNGLPPQSGCHCPTCRRVTG